MLFRSVEGEEDDFFIPEGQAMNAMHQDIVQMVMTSVGGDVNGKKMRREGRVTQIVEHTRDHIVGMFRSNKSFGFVLPDNQKFDFDVYMAKEHTKGAVSGQKVIAKITNYGSKTNNPEGKVVEILGHVNDPGVDILSVVHAYGLTAEFPLDVMLSVEQMDSEVTEEDKIGRLDLRDKMTVTIDGEDAKDLDDAITLEKKGEHYVLGVHIADVSHYVREKSPLDKEALKRGTSVYLTDRVIPMLPHALSNGICSLLQYRHIPYNLTFQSDI